MHQVHSSRRWRPASLVEVLTRPARGPANRVTLVRAVLVCVVAVVAFGGESRGRVPVLVSLAAVALVLDGVDGCVARRTNSSSAFGARFDMEVDALLILVLSAYAAPAVGWWVLLIGAARYLFGAAKWPLPWLRGTAPPRRWCKVVAVVQGVTLTIAAAEVLPLAWNRVLLAVALALLAESFGREAWELWRASGRDVREAVRRTRSALLTGVAVAATWIALVLPDRAAHLTPGAFAEHPAGGAGARRAGPRRAGPVASAGSGGLRGTARRRARPQGARPGLLHGARPALRPAQRRVLPRSRGRRARRLDRAAARGRGGGRGRRSGGWAGRRDVLAAVRLGRPRRRGVASSPPARWWRSAWPGCICALDRRPGRHGRRRRLDERRRPGRTGRCASCAPTSPTGRSSRPRDRHRPDARRSPAASSAARPAREGRRRWSSSRATDGRRSRASRSRPGSTAVLDDGSRRLQAAGFQHAQRLPDLADVRRGELAGALAPCSPGCGSTASSATTS